MEFVKTDLAEPVSSESLIFLPGVGEIAQLQCRLYSHLPSFFQPVPQLENANMSLEDTKKVFTYHFLAVSLKVWVFGLT
jgi:hypothetical protein